MFLSTDKIIVGKVCNNKEINAHAPQVLNYKCSKFRGTEMQQKYTEFREKKQSSTCRPVVTDDLRTDDPPWGADPTYHTVLENELHMERLWDSREWKFK